MVTVLAFSLFLLGGCGGGGSGDTPGPGPAPDPDMTAMEAWQGNWSGSGTATGLIGDDPAAMTGGTATITVSSLNFQAASAGEHLVELTLAGSATGSAEGQQASVTVSGFKVLLFGEERADGDLAITGFRVTEGSGTATIPGWGEFPFDVQESTEPLARDFPEPLLLKNTGFDVDLNGSQDGMEGEGQATAVLSGNTLTLDASGAGSAAMGLAEDVVLHMTLRK